MSATWHRDYWHHAPRSSLSAISTLIPSTFIRPYQSFDKAFPLLTENLKLSIHHHAIFFKLTCFSIDLSQKYSDMQPAKPLPTIQLFFYISQLSRQ